MTDEYDAVTAHHYNAYRPPLHARILNACLDENKRCASGLDIGSGTGHSTIALRDFCNLAIGVEPSEAMRIKAIAYPNVSYVDFNGKELKFDDDHFDILTLAGSLFYAKSQTLLDELFRVGTNGATIIVYDFDLDIASPLSILGIENSSDHPYNHEEDFSGLRCGGLELLEKEQTTTALSVQTSNLAHVILSIQEYYVFLQEKYGSDSLFEKVVSRLEGVTKSKALRTEAKLFWTAYRIIK